MYSPCPADLTMCHLQCGSSVLRPSVMLLHSSDVFVNDSMSQNENLLIFDGYKDDLFSQRNMSRSIV